MVYNQNLLYVAMLAKSNLLALLTIVVVNAYIIISNPVPYSKDTLNNSPLAADSSNFPYKLRSNTYEIIEKN